MSDDLTIVSGARSAASRKTAIERIYEHRGSRAAGCSRATVSILCPNTSGLDARTVRTDASSPRKSGTSTSTRTPGHAARIAPTVMAKCAAPPSGKSSRVTDVTTTCANPSLRAASATRTGSSGSMTAVGPCPTAQNVQFRVQFSPRSINVAVRRPQHSDWFGHRALRHTVCNPKSFKTSCVAAITPPDAHGRRIQSGNCETI